MNQEFLEHSARIAVFEWCDNLRLRFGDVLPRNELEKGVPFAAASGGVIRVIGPQGIFKPRDFQLPLSITTSPESPYRDAYAGGFLIYKYRGTDPHHPDNVGLRHAALRGIPLVYFHGLVPGRYLATYPVFIKNDNVEAMHFLVAVDEKVLGPGQSEPIEDVALRRRYATTLVWRRIHQQAFRERVIAAYHSQCTMCRLRHKELLDAAHIVPDCEEGEPNVSNGLSLCKLHHAAFDRLLISVTPDFRIEVRGSILREEDGPVLEHGLKQIHGAAIQLPGKTAHWPDRDALARHLEIFRRAA